jgi:hypothetical protein
VDCSTLCWATKLVLGDQGGREPQCVHGDSARRPQPVIYDHRIAKRVFRARRIREGRHDPSGGSRVERRGLPRSSSSLLSARVAEEAEKQQHDDDDDDDQENAERWPPFGVAASILRDASSRKRDPLQSP